jgi:glycogen debranching enzyme
MPDPAELADRVKAHFTDVFWNPENGCLDDVAGCSPPDNRIRPNQILSMSLSFPVFSGELARKALDTVYGKLHVPLGFRSLDAGHEQFRARYEGDQYVREGAMHQGTAWPWFIGPFVTAWKRNHADDPDLERFLKDVFLPFEDHLLDGGLGCISQLVDGTHPHEPRGCISQAWCVAEVLRAYLEDYASVARRADKGGG